MTCREAIQAVFENESVVLSAEQVIQRIHADHPGDPWKQITIRLHLVGLSVNHPSSVHHPNARRHAFLFFLGNDRYRLWNPDQDGKWIVEDGMVRLAGEPAEVPVPEVEGVTEASPKETALSLERDLEACLISNLAQLEPGLRLYNAEGVFGRQLDTGVVGRLDILAVDREGDLVVIELKAGRAEDRVCGQLLRYMGWVKRELSQGSRVRGIVVANDFTEALIYASQAMPDVSLQRYEVKFSFSNVS